MASISITSLLAGMSPAQIRDLFTRDVNRAAAWVRVTALDGVAEGQLCYGRMLLAGTGVPKDTEAAFRWFQRAAAQGNVDAINMVGRCYDMGWGTQANPEAAAEHFHRAADVGHAWAQYNLGHLYLDGRGVGRDRARAYLYYLRAAEQGHERAMNLVGRCCEQGWGRPADPAEAAVWYERSAQGGYFRGQYNWATRLLEGGRHEEAACWFERAAQSGTPAVRAAAQAAISLSSRTHPGSGPPQRTRGSEPNQQRPPLIEAGEQESTDEDHPAAQASYGGPPGESNWARGNGSGVTAQPLWVACPEQGEGNGTEQDCNGRC